MRVLGYCRSSGANVSENCCFCTNCEINSIFFLCQNSDYSLHFRAVLSVIFLSAGTRSLTQTIWISCKVRLFFASNKRKKSIPNTSWKILILRINQCIQFLFDGAVKSQRISIRNIKKIAKRSFNCQSFCYVSRCKVMEKFINLWLKALQLDLWNWNSVPKTIIEILTSNSYLAISFKKRSEFHWSHTIN